MSIKIMVLTAATGGGHLKTSSTVENYVKNNTSYEIVVVDTLKSISALLDKTICDSYLFMARKAPSLFGILYKETNKDNTFSKLVPKFNGGFSRMLLPRIQAVNPDVILTTHPFATEMVAYLKKRGEVDAPLICIITDYGLHRAWIADEVDSYVVACEDMVGELKALGVDENKVHPFGIPVNKEFFGAKNAKEVVQDIGFNPYFPTVLFMAGSFGVTKILKLFRELETSTVPLQLIVITGKNQKLYETFEQAIANHKNENLVDTKLIYYTDEVEKYMHAADLIVTKPGGLTVSEALACNLPLAVFDAIPGQEEDNCNFLLTHNMGVKLDKENSLADTVSGLLEQRDKLNEMRKNCENFDTSNSIVKTLALAESLVCKKTRVS